jgi:hypothetical protein
MGRCADELGKSSTPQPGFLKARAGGNKLVRLGAGGAERGCRFLPTLPLSRSSSLLLGGAWGWSVELEAPTEASTGVANPQGMQQMASEFAVSIVDSTE